MRSALEQVENAIGNEAAAQHHDVAVAESMLMAAEEPHRLHQMQVLSGARHRDIENPALLLDLVALADAMSDGIQPSMTFGSNASADFCASYPSTGLGVLSRR